MNWLSTQCSHQVPWGSPCEKCFREVWHSNDLEKWGAAPYAAVPAGLTVEKLASIGPDECDHSTLRYEFTHGDVVCNDCGDIRYPTADELHAPHDYILRDPTVACIPPPTGNPTARRTAWNALTPPHQAEIMREVAELVNNFRNKPGGSLERAVEGVISVVLDG